MFNRQITLTIFCLALSFLMLPLSLPAQVKIMPIGDSITQGMNVGYDNLNGLNSYRRFLWLLLENANIDVDFVGSQTEVYGTPTPENDFDKDHEGYGGWRADQILYGNWYGTTLSTWMATHNPDVTLVHIGTNDLIQGQSVLSTLGEIGAMIDTMRVYNPYVQIYLAQIIGSTYPWNTQVDSLNSNIPALAAAKTMGHSPITVVNMPAVFNPVIHNVAGEGVHPNIAGEQVMAQAWFDAITNTSFPVEFLAFEAEAKGDQALLKWATATELNNFGFEVEVLKNGEFEEIGFVTGMGTTSEVSEYEFRTEKLSAGTQVFRLRQVDFDGKFSFSDRVSVEIFSEAAALKLYPNPASSRVYIELAGQIAELSSLSVFDIRGGQHLVNARIHTSGNENTSWELDTAQLRPGMYLVKLEALGRIYTEKLIIEN